MNIHSTETGGTGSATWAMGFQIESCKRDMILRGIWMSLLLFEGVGVDWVGLVDSGDGF